MHEEIVQRGYDFHTLRHECALTWTFIIDYRDALVGIFLVLQRDVVADGGDKIFHTIGHSIDLQQTFFVALMRKHGIRQEGSVEFGHTHCL